ncbi:MAG: RNA pseudouridine synthase [Cyclobacteriaceae bacterium]|nr:RNA pseudouridine synthase [Cyclobacteriaceae bacterium]
MEKKLEVLFEDNHLLIVNKPAGLLSQGDRTGDESMLDIGKQYIKEKYKKPGDVFLGLVHRLDRPVSGVLLLARTSKALERLNASMREGTIKKTYWALTEKQPEELSGHLVHWLEKIESDNRVIAHREASPNRKKATLSYEMVQYIKGKCLLEVNPQTGRPHQIRVQLSKIGCPIIGDNKYGWKGKKNAQEIGLHARKLEFNHPVTKEAMEIVAPVKNNPFIQAFMINAGQR